MAKITTSSAGSAHRDCRSVDAQCGYTLLELLVVLAIISLLLSLFGGMTAHRHAVESPIFQAELIESDLVRARSTAMMQGNPIDVVFSAGLRSWRVGATVEKSLPEGVDLTLRTAAVAGLLEDQNLIRFFPNGSSSGGEITLSHGGQSAAIKIDWLTGRIGLVRHG